MDVREPLRRLASQLGFAGCGFAPAGPLPRRPFLAAWLAAGRAAGMTYLAARREERLDPRRRAPWVRGVVSLAWPYRPPPAPPADWQRSLTGRVAAYARGSDYHEVVLGAIEKLAAALRDLSPGVRALAYVDTGPVLERDWGYRAGLGWFGRNTMLLDREAGSYFLLGELLVSIPFPAPDTPARSFCGTCHRCVESCPTGALSEGYVLDARRCLSYLTIEHREAIPPELRPALANLVFGCDICQEACPWNPPPGSPEPELSPALPALLALDETTFRARYGATALARARRRGLVRNAAIALGNSANREAVGPLAARLATEPDPTVRAHLAWALGRLGGRSAREALDSARLRETDPTTAAEIEVACGLMG